MMCASSEINRHLAELSIPPNHCLFMLCDTQMPLEQHILYFSAFSNDFLSLLLPAGEEGPWTLRESIQQHLQGNC